MSLSCLLVPLSWGDNQAVIRVEKFELPRYSDYLSAETRAGIERWELLSAKALELCNPATKTTGKEIRACEAQMYPPILKEANRLFKVRIVPKIIAGVQTDVVTPVDGVPPRNQRRVLINAHGGSFKYGARFGGQLEAMPIAAIGEYKVVTVDYRMEPEHRFPAASIDIEAVYKELLKEHDPSSIGLYGCSAGGRIVGQTIAWMSEQKLPAPGAVAILCSAPMNYGGDSNVIVAALHGGKPRVRNFDDGSAA
jgi:epsilon-lactone hydrolase